MLDEFVKAALQPFFEVGCYWVGKIAIRLFGVRCSFDDEWGICRKNRSKNKPPWTWTQSQRRYLRSDIVQLIGLILIGAVIAGVVWWCKS